MRISFVKMMIAALALVGAMAAPAAAQGNGTTVGANLTFLRDSEQTGAGFLVDAAKALNPTVAVVGEFGLNSFDGFTLTSYQGGVRFLPAVQASVQPFLQALVGLEHCCEQNAFAFQIGGGVEIPFNETLKFRVQYDFRRTSYDGEGYNANRFGVGVVLPLGN
ncbi:MAG: hypothetical protein IT183_13575 [Acidobacteria bacterium]|nr:hypothetical protein [Acidobacteriota bacterium]